MGTGLGVYLCQVPRLAMDLLRGDREFPRPPISFSDSEGRQITIKSYVGSPEPLLGMYEAFEEPVRRGLPPQTEADRKNWLDVLLTEGINVVARYDWGVVGHATLVPQNGSSELLIFVRPDKQSQGIGTQLLQGLLGFGQANGIEHVWLSVTCDNLPLIRLCTGLGFAPPPSAEVEFKLEREL